MANEVVEEFARLLILYVRDEAVRNVDALFTNRGPKGRRWREVVATMQAEEAVRELAPDIVDRTVGQLLDAIERGLLALYFRPGDGQPVDLAEVGRSEILGWYCGGEDGWLTRFSSERFHDDYA